MYFNLLLIIPEEIWELNDSVKVIHHIRDVLDKFLYENGPTIRRSYHDLSIIYDKCKDGDIDSYNKFCNVLGIDAPKEDNEKNNLLIYDDYNIVYNGSICEISDPGLYESQIIYQQKVDYSFIDNILWALSLGYYKRVNKHNEIYDIGKYDLKLRKNVLQVSEFVEKYDLNIFLPIIDSNENLHIDEEKILNNEFVCDGNEFYKTLLENNDNYIILIGCNN